MISISTILSVDDINLALAAEEKLAAIQEVLFLLHGDARILDFKVLCSAVEGHNAPAISVGGMGICIAHERTNAVSSLVLAVGRSDKGIRCREIPEPVHLFFVAGIPKTFDHEYLRVVGALVRACSNTEILRFLLETHDQEEFLNQLSSVETPL